MNDIHDAEENAFLDQLRQVVGPKPTHLDQSILSVVRDQLAAERDFGGVRRVDRAGGGAGADDAD